MCVRCDVQVCLLPRIDREAPEFLRNLLTVRLGSGISQKVAAAAEMSFVFLITCICKFFLLRQLRCCGIALATTLIVHCNHTVEYHKVYSGYYSTAHVSQGQRPRDALTIVPNEGEGKGTATCLSVLAPTFHTLGLCSLPIGVTCVCCVVVRIACFLRV